MSHHSSNEKIPYHIAIIPDGNRRWARKHGVDILKGHEKGIEKIGDLLKWCKEKDIRMVTMWGFSTENRNRTQQEVEGLMQLFEKNLIEVLNRAEKEKGNEDKYPKVRVRFYGDIEDLPEKLVRYIREVERRTEKNDEYFVNFLLNYGGVPEIVDCFRKVLLDFKSGKIMEINEEEIKKRLWTGEIPPPDLIIRTSGEMRLSGFMPLQSGYSELFFVDKYWPDFSREDFDKVITEYSLRERRFGR
ncbi:MAG: polyprenyl diphosphate synthase [Candidatus Micrarchaeia archaeon]